MFKVYNYWIDLSKLYLVVYSRGLYSVGNVYSMLRLIDYRVIYVLGVLFLFGFFIIIIFYGWHWSLQFIIYL